MHDIRDRHDFKDGEIQSVTVERHSVVIRSHCSATASGELETRVNMNQDGRIYLHFSFLGSNLVRPSQVCANGVDIKVVSEDEEDE